MLIKKVCVRYIILPYFYIVPFLMITSRECFSNAKSEVEMTYNHQVFCARKILLDV